MKPSDNISVTGAPRRKAQAWLLGVFLVLAVIFSYQPAWNAGFIWDDDDYVTHNPLLTAPDGLKRIWFSTDSPSQYFPLVYTTFRLEYSLWGLNAAGYHWVNILLHAINALLVWRLLRVLAIPGAWLGAALFALHPVQVESVAWITELKNVQSLFFFVLSLLAWVEFVERRRGWGAYGLALLFYALSLFSKTTACTLPAALVLVLWLRQKPIDRARVFQIVPFVLMGIAMGLVSMWWERNHQGTEGELYAMSLLERVLVASRAIWFYLGKLLWPANLIFNYPLWKINPADVLAYVWLLAGGGLIAAILAVRRLVGRGLEVATVFYVAMLSPLLGFIMLYTFRYTFVADHYQYVAVIGPLALIAAGLTRFFGVFENQRRWLQPLVCGALVLTLGVLTWRQSRMYHDLETLWQTTIERNPDSYMGHNNLGAIYLAKGQVDAAIARFERALEILPGHGNAHGNLGNALLQKGRVDEAIGQFQKAVEAEPRVAKAHSDLALGLLQKGRVDETIVHARKALELQPRFAEAHNHLGWALLQRGEADAALGHFRTALEVQPASPDAHYNVGTALLHQGRTADAADHLAKAIELRPDFPKALNNLGNALVQSGRPDEAIGRFEAALKVHPEDAETRGNLGRTLIELGRIEEALTHFEKDLELRPGAPDARYNLATVYFKKGQIADALAQFEAVVNLQPENPEFQNNLGWALLQTGRTDDAIQRFETVLRLQPDFALAHNNLALAALQKKRGRDAAAHYRAFLALQPEHPAALSDLSWLLATWPERSVRNGADAVDLARRAVELTGGENPVFLRSLAAAFAETGKFEDALATARRAASLADAAANAALGEALRAEMKLYEAHSPVRETIPGFEPDAAGSS
jgi:protein O-mannosyl-transferase